MKPLYNPGVLSQLIIQTDWKVLKHINTWTVLQSWLTRCKSGLNRFQSLETHQIHVKLLYCPGVFNQLVVLTESKLSKHIELMWNYFIYSADLISLKSDLSRFESFETFSLCKTNYWFTQSTIVNQADSKLLKHIKFMPVKLPYSPGLLSLLVIRTD